MSFGVNLRFILGFNVVFSSFPRSLSRFPRRGMRIASEISKVDISRDFADGVEGGDVTEKIRLTDGVL
jgi:hypothetical protein